MKGDIRLDRLPDAYPTTREALRALACFVVAPAVKAATTHISLRATGDGFGTPPFGDPATRILVRGTQLVVETATGERATAITNLADAAAFVGVDLRPDPGVGRDLPPYDPDAPLRVDEAASFALGAWYAFADGILAARRTLLDAAGTASEIRLWPEHFDIAFDFAPADGRRVNLGASPGDSFSEVPYLYVGPWDTTDLADPIWNAPFGAALTYDALCAAADPAAAAESFLAQGLAAASR